MVPMPSHQANPQAQTTQQVWQQQTIPHATIADPSATSSSPPADPVTTVTKKRVSMRIVATAIVIALAIALYLIWHAPTTTTTTSSPIITQQNHISTAPPATSASTDTSGFIQVYIVGAVKHPGVYKLPADARVYQLLQAAGGPLPNANLVALNMAAKLTDGQEVYVTVVGEAPPTYLGGVPGPGTPNSGSLVNINTASAAEMQQMLHVSSKTAQAIVDYRLQHGNYSTVEDLAQVVSKSIYDKIKGLVTI